MAELKVYSGQCELGGGIIHMGATSVDIKDNATAIQIKSSIELLLVKLNQVINSF
ncbi:MAG: adenylosuccinate lyase, partial [Gammaproteobacteria bacterium]|nr:adenylosuccinate lyase [Gammaproteobacteria bacterium]